MSQFQEAYKKLNSAQKQAVDTIEGPVMVVAGPGTGKTQILTLRIAHILNETDTPADGILCLTFTNSGVRAMQERLRTYIGASASRVVISTFHSFGMKLIEEFYPYLDFDTAPVLADELQSVSLCDEILHAHDWKHIRSRANPALYFNDIKSLVSLLKRERISPNQFLEEIEREVVRIKNDPENISSRGPTKGNLKADALKKLEGFERTREIVTFYELYEEKKRERGILDYDDVLESLVTLVGHENVRDEIRERFLYVLVDEHQDSSGVQNQFLARVWGKVEQANIFVVGDDRQLIYGFGGASLDQFKSFTETFPGVQIITLTDNYRSTQIILDSADALLKSSLADAWLKGNREGNEKLELVEADYPRDEIIAAGLSFKEKIDGGLDPNECALLVPKNAQVKSAMRVLRDLGIPVAQGNALKLFETSEAQNLIAILRALSEPMKSEYIVPILLSDISNVAPLVVHEYLIEKGARKVTLAELVQADNESLANFGKQLVSFLDIVQTQDIYSLVQVIGDVLFLKTAKDHENLTRRVEVLRTFLHIILLQIERKQGNEKLSLSEFLQFIDRLVEYGTDIPLAVFSADQGVQVMTLHASKGLEFEHVWIAHMDEKSLNSKRIKPFTLPESIEQHLEEKDELVIKRQLYVAITRAKRYCTLSFARSGYTGAEQTLAHVIADLPPETFITKNLASTEEFIKAHNVTAYVAKEPGNEQQVTLQALSEMVSSEYVRRNVSVSSLNNFFECPWKWYFRNLLQLPEPENISLQFGNIIHGSIEKILKSHSVPDEQDLEKYIKESSATIHAIDDRERVRLERDAQDILNRWTKERLGQVHENYESEYPFYNVHDPEFPNLKITGKIDLLESLDEIHVKVTDFKTGKPKTKNDIEKLNEEDRMSDYMRQLAMYSYLLELKTGGNREVTESCLEFVESSLHDKNAVYATKINGDHIEHLKQDLRDYDQLLKSGEWINRPCYFKSYGKANAECEYCKLAEMYKKDTI